MSTLLKNERSCDNASANPVLNLVSFNQGKDRRPDSDDQLEIVVFSEADFPFCDSSNLIAADSIDASNRLGYVMVRSNLKRYANIEMPTPCSWPTYVLKDNGDELHIVLHGPQQFISYLWSKDLAT